MNHPSQFFQALYQHIETGYAELRLLYEHQEENTFLNKDSAISYLHKLQSMGYPHSDIQYNKENKVHNTPESWSVVVYAERIYRPAKLIHTGDFNVVDEFNFRNYHIYHRNAVTYEKRSRKDDVSAITCLWCDIDGQERPSSDFWELDLPPTMLINSGGGWHLYWLLKTPLIIADEKTRYLVEQIMQGIILDLGGNADPHAKDITRILRTPFFKNIKAKYAPDYPECSVVWYDDSQGDRYHFAQLEKRYAPLGAPAKPKITRHIPSISQAYPKYPQWIQDYLDTGAGLGERNQRLYAVARWFNDVGQADSNAEAMLLSRAHSDGLSQYEAKTTIRSAWRNVPDPSARLPYHIQNVMRTEDE